jgi:Kef-type K+ transport system membrane component KefB
MLWCMLRNTAFMAAATLAFTPANAAMRLMTLEEIKTAAGELGAALLVYADRAGIAAAAYAQAIAAGDMAMIRATSFVLSALIGLIGFWLLVVGPRAASDVILLGYHGDADPEEAVREQETDRPMRFLEAVAAAKAQMAISEAEKKHGA